MKHGSICPESADEGKEVPCDADVGLCPKHAQKDDEVKAAEVGIALDGENPFLAPWISRR